VLVSVLTVAGTATLVAVLSTLTGSLLDAISTTMLIIPAGAALGYFALMFRSPKVTARERSHLRAYIPLWIGAGLVFMISGPAAAVTPVAPRPRPAADRLADCLGSRGWRAGWTVEDRAGRTDGTRAVRAHGGEAGRAGAGR